MRVPEVLQNAFGPSFEERLARLAHERGLLPSPEDIRSPRYLARSIVPHVMKLSSLFNREEKEQGEGLDPYWKESSRPENLRLAYFLYFMPCNLFRLASVWAELGRLGFKWGSSGDAFRAIEFGAGPASGATGIAAAEALLPLGIPAEGNWALIEQDRAMLSLGEAWAKDSFEAGGFPGWSTRPFHRKIDLARGLLPAASPKFHLWVMSYFLNEFSQAPTELADALLDSWERHLEEEGIAILVEPALRLQSRRLLEIRRALIKRAEERKLDWFKVLLPCLGHQSCGALADAEDWCHEDVSWWRPPYMRRIDDMAKLDRKSLPFSYLVIARSSKRSREEILPELADTAPEGRQRLVSPAHGQGKELEFFLCGQAGKCRARVKPGGKEDPASALDRGDILIGCEMRGDEHARRIEKIQWIVGTD